MNESELDRVIEIVLLDAYGEEEETVAWETVLEDVIDARHRQSFSARR